MFRPGHFPLAALRAIPLDKQALSLYSQKDFHLGKSAVIFWIEKRARFPGSVLQGREWMKEELP
jgi:hypothetical protein